MGAALPRSRVMGASTATQQVPVRVEVPAEVGPAGVVEQGEGQVGLEHGVA